MRNSLRHLNLAAPVLLLVPGILAQTNPPPSDPHEPVTEQTRILSKMAERLSALELLERARRNYNLRDLTVPYAVKVSFETRGELLAEGPGTMEELSDGGRHWRWSAQLQDTLVVRLGDAGHAYGSSPSMPIPGRVQLLRSVLHWPMPRNAGASAIRAAEVERDGKAMTCFLLSASIPQNPAPRSWVESEYCIEKESGLLQSWSEAPGIYAEYDYAGASEFHNHLFPKQVSVFEQGRLAVQARVESLEELAQIDPKQFEPTEPMLAAGAAFTLSMPSRFPLRVDPIDNPTSPYYQPVIVHAILDAEDGHVVEAESLQSDNPGLSRSALDIVRDARFAPSGFQQEVFINVQFHLPATRLGGPPEPRLPVRWIMLDHRRKVQASKVRPPHVSVGTANDPSERF